MSRLKKAMEKARLARQGENNVGTGPVKEGLIQAVPDSKSETGAGKPRAGRVPGSPTAGCKIQVTYTQTHVAPVDPRILRRSKILSLFHENGISERIKILRTQIVRELEQVAGNSLMVTSANPGEGKTFTSLNLGASIAQELGRTVLIVDTDLRREPRHHKRFCEDFLGLHPRLGLSDYLMGHAQITDILINPGIPKLTLIPGGKAVENSAELLGSSKMAGLVAELKERYCEDRIVIFDSASLLVCTDPLVFSKGLDGVLLVVEAERTTPRDVSQVLSLLKDHRIFGAAYNKAP